MARHTPRNFFAYVTSPRWEGKKEIHVIGYDAPGALIDIHRVLQTTRELGERRQIIRPQLKPDEYALTKFFIRYDDFDNASVESVFDLPNTPNPCFSEKRTEKPCEQSSFGFPEEHIWRRKR